MDSASERAGGATALAQFLKKRPAVTPWNAFNRENVRR
jgi:hypothetical protein